MKKFNHLVAAARICIIAFVLSTLTLFLFSFTVSYKMADDFFKQLGISQKEGDKKITGSILEGYMDAYGARNAKNIALGNRSAVTKDLLNYTKKYVTATSFIKEYSVLKESKKPAKHKTQTPDEMQQQMIQDAKKAVSENEASLKKADPAFKKIFEDVLTESKKQLKAVEDPNNKQITNYRKNYEKLVKETETIYQQHIADWEKQYPANHLHFIKKRLEQFLLETKDIDFSAELASNNGKKYFIKKEYESKGGRWKMAFRAGKEVVIPAREFVEQWIAEIK
jgi:predicted DNA-binding protein (UPF0278 family)